MRRTLIVAVAVLGGLVVGYLLGASLARRVPLGAEESVEWHWKRVNDYLTVIKDPKNLGRVEGIEFIGCTEPYDPESSLLALSQAGEIYGIELLLPTVPENRTINEYWIKYLQERPDVLMAQGLPQSSAIRFTGKQPLYLKIWCKESALADIQKLVDELEALAAEEGHAPKPAE